MKKIEIKGAIISDGNQWIYDWFEIPATSPKKVAAELAKAEKGEEIELEISSGGGEVYAGSEIYTALKSYDGKVTGKVVGIAASAASVIAMSADKLLISPTAQMMIHRSSIKANGNKNHLEHIADVLSGIDESIATAYQIKTGMAPVDLLEMMNKETWLTPKEAVEMKFADEIMFADEFMPTNSITDSGGMLPQAVIDKMRIELKSKEACSEKEQASNFLQTAKSKLNLLINI